MRILFLLLIVSTLCYSCKNNRKQTEIEQTVSEWTGKQIKFPVNYQCCVFGKDTVDDICTELFDKDYKILLYIDSTGCTSCRFHLEEWQVIMQDMSSYAEKVSFLFFFYPKRKIDIQYLLKSERFSYPVFIDEMNEINRLNCFPATVEYQCFLLDKDNKVLVVGNPVLNLKIWDLYKQIITGEISDKPTVTVVEPEQTEIELKDLRTGKTSEAIFKLKNAGTNPLIIQTVNASCGCTVPEWKKQPVEAGKSTEIRVKITPEKSEYFNKTVTVHCNTEAGQISLKVKGTVEQ
jgi:hypothetical protein